MYGFIQKRFNFNASAMELHLFSMSPSRCNQKLFLHTCITFTFTLDVSSPKYLDMDGFHHKIKWFQDHLYDGKSYTGKISSLYLNDHLLLQKFTKTLSRKTGISIPITCKFGKCLFSSAAELLEKFWNKTKNIISILQIDGLVQERLNSSVLAMELRLSCTNPSKYRAQN